MIADNVELKVAVRDLAKWREALRGLREQLAEENPWLLGITEPAYVRRIESLQSDIAAYLCEHPDDIAFILPPIELAVAEK